MEVSSLVNIQKGARVLDISTRALHERIKAGYYKVRRLGSILVDPKTNEPLTTDSLEAIPIRPRGRPPGRYGNYKRKKRVGAARGKT